MDARSALLDLYGDHLRARDDAMRGQAPVASLVRLMAPLDVQAPAVRTAVSRMCRQGWLMPVRLPTGGSGDAASGCPSTTPGYALTPRAARRLDDAAERIYRTGRTTWDGTWHLLVVSPPPGRSDRARLHTQLSWFGYGALNPTTWVSPRPAPELDAALADMAVRAERFTAVHDGDSQALIARAWDLDGLARTYRRFLAEAQDALTGAGVRSDEGAFVARSRLVHAWRKFLFVDPGLPPALLPPDWPGTKAAAWFDEEAQRLLPAARRFVDRCLSGGPAPAAAPGRVRSRAVRSRHSADPDDSAATDQEA